MGTVGTSLKSSHEHDLMQAEGNGTAFFLFPFEAGVKSVRGNGKNILQIRGHQDNTIFKGHRGFAGHIAEDPGGCGKQGRNRNRGKEFPAKQIAGRRRIIDQRTNQRRSLKRTAMAAGREDNRGAD